MKIVVPQWKSVTTAAPVAAVPWPGDLAGKTVGLLHNIKLNGDVILDHYAGQIAERYPGVAVERARKPHSAMGMTERERTALAQCDLVLVALGD